MTPKNTATDESTSTCNKGLADSTPTTRDAQPEYLTTAQLEKKLNLCPGTITKGRSVGRADIPFVKIGTKAIRYRRADVEQYLLARTIRPGTSK